MFALAIVVVPALEVADQVRQQRIRSAATKAEFMVKVRDCVHGRSGPARPWEVCEVLAGDSE